MTSSPGGQFSDRRLGPGRCRLDFGLGGCVLGLVLRAVAQCAEFDAGECLRFAGGVLVRPLAHFALLRNLPASSIRRVESTFRVTHALLRTPRTACGGFRARERVGGTLTSAGPGPPT